MATTRAFFSSRYQFVVFMILSFLFYHRVESKINDKYFLSKCSCSSFGKPDCDFEKLTKKNLQKLVEKLLNHRIVCVKSDEYFLPTFSASLFSAPYSPSNQAKENEKEKEKEQACPPVKNETIVKTLPSDCKIDGLHCATNKGVDFLFPTTLLTHQLIRDETTKKFNEELKEIMLNLEKEQEGCTFHLHGGYRSQDGFLHRPEPSIQWLRQQISARVKLLLGYANATDVEFEVDGWGAVLRGGDGQSAHVHPGSMYAGVYYVTVPKEVESSNKDGGCLEFMDPRPGAPMAQVLRGKNLYGDNFQICPGADGGLLVMFPSWLMHEVKPMPMNYTGPRIGISFNAIYKPLFQMRAQAMQSQQVQQGTAKTLSTSSGTSKTSSTTGTTTTAATTASTTASTSKKASSSASKKTKAAKKPVDDYEDDEL